MKKYPLISIIVPSYNQGQFLNQALSSIFKQYYPRLEVIVMDGGSTDNSVAVIQSFASKITYWQSKPDGGQAAAINEGMKRATGDLVAWLNSDDYYLKDAFKHLMKVYRKNPNAAFYAGNGYRVTATGLIKEPFYKTDDIVFDRHSLIYTVDYILQPTTFMNRECLMKANYLNPALHYGMDWDLFIRLSEYAQPIIFFDFMAASREYPDTKTASGYFKRIEELRGIAKKHSGLELSPGVMCYLIGDLIELCEKHPEVYKGSYFLELHKLWNENTAVIASCGMDRTGYLIRKKNKDSGLFRLFSKVMSIIVIVYHQLLALLKSVYRSVVSIIPVLKKHLDKFRVKRRFMRRTSRAARQIIYRFKYGFYAK